MAHGYIVIISTQIMCNKCGGILKVNGHKTSGSISCTGGCGYHSFYTILSHEYYVYEKPPDMDPALISQTLKPLEDMDQADLIAEALSEGPIECESCRKPMDTIVINSLVTGFYYNFEEGRYRSRQGLRKHLTYHCPMCGEEQKGFKERNKIKNELFTRSQSAKKTIKIGRARLTVSVGLKVWRTMNKVSFICNGRSIATIKGEAFIMIPRIGEQFLDKGKYYIVIDIIHHLDYENNDNFVDVHLQMTNLEDNE